MLQNSSGVPTMMCAPCSKEKRCWRQGTPPQRSKILTLWDERANLRSSLATCSASSLVGQRTRDWMFIFLTHVSAKEAVYQRRLFCHCLFWLWLLHLCQLGQAVNTLLGWVSSVHNKSLRFWSIAGSVMYWLKLLFSLKACLLVPKFIAKLYTSISSHLFGFIQCHIRKLNSLPETIEYR